MSLRICLVAGEASGDLLGAALIEALRLRYPHAQFFGVAGPKMKAVGCEAWYPSESLSVMGLAEVLQHLPSLLRIRATLVERLSGAPPDVFIGIDAPDFNLALERKLRARGIKTVHYVSPSVWAWRRYRVKKIRRAVDLMLTVFPFEEAFYADADVPAQFVGHPLADQLQPQSASQVRATLGLQADPVVALLPGSRRSEVSRLIVPFLETARWLTSHYPDIAFLLPTATAATELIVNNALRAFPDINVRVMSGGARDAISASDVVLLASGTAALEAMLLGRPMVVAYRLHPVTYAIVSRLLTVDWFSLPNILLKEGLVPEFVQDDVCPAKLGPAIRSWIDNGASRNHAMVRFREIRQGLAQNSADRAASAIASLLDR